jgi:hypothetical protein
MSLEPKERFKETTLAFKDQIMKVFNDYIVLVPDAVQNMFRDGQALIKAKQPEKFAEIEGIAEVLGLETYEVLCVNYLYELTTACTSLVAQMPDGTILHGRNLDFSFPDDMRLATYKAQFYNGSEYKFDAVMFAGNVGVYTGIKHGKFSISENQRRVPDIVQTVLDNVVMIF